jgi:hypothetical protein
MMNYPPPRFEAPPRTTAGSVAETVTGAAGHVSSAAGQAIDQLAAFRLSVRRSPLTMSALMLGLGYVIGTITHTWPGTRR